MYFFENEGYLRVYNITVFWIIITVHSEKEGFTWLKLIDSEEDVLTSFYISFEDLLLIFILIKYLLISHKKKFNVIRKSKVEDQKSIFNLCLLNNQSAFRFISCICLDFYSYDILCLLLGLLKASEL